jgi:hypothetical protein
LWSPYVRTVALVLLLRNRRVAPHSAVLQILTKKSERYLPNTHYLKLIERYNTQNESRVQIFSESTSFESFDVFRERGYHVVLDGDIGDVWKGILTSDIAILSKSSFSLVPALMSKGTIVYTPFWHPPLPNWDIVDDVFLNETNVEFRRLEETCPKKKKEREVEGGSIE